MYLELYNNNRKKRAVKLRVNKLAHHRRSWREEKMGGNKIIIIENCKIL
jgi:uridine kinase